MTLAEIARRSVPLIDLTSLGDRDTKQQIDDLCDAALGHSTAAVCVWPRLVAQCVRRTAGTPVAVATVVNFPHGGADIDAAVAETCKSVDRGADEIDLVMPYRAWLDGDESLASDMIGAVKAVCAEASLKVILETGRLGSKDNISAASKLAILNGADFIKTSTGKISTSATPSAAQVMLTAIKVSGKSVGFKAAGGIRTLRQAGNYLRLADRIMGDGWANPGTFRFGASSLLDACLPYLEESA